MEKLILFGIGPFAHQMFRYLKDDDRYEVAAFCVEEKYMNGKTEFNGLPVVSFESVTEKYPPMEYKFLVCIGYTQMNKVREKIFNECLAKGYDLPNYIHKEVVIRAETIGYGNILYPNCILDIGTKIGNGNVVGQNSFISHDCNIGNFNWIAGAVAFSGDVMVRNNCFLGTNCTLKDGIEINDGTLIGAACYISHNTEPWSVFAVQKTTQLKKVSSLTMMRFYSEK